MKNNNNTFSITLTPHEAMQVKVNYENQGYRVNMMEVNKASHIDNTYKYHFTLTASHQMRTLNNNSNLLLEGAMV